jgi:hypothetical protein
MVFIGPRNPCPRVRYGLGSYSSLGPQIAGHVRIPGYADTRVPLCLDTRNSCVQDGLVCCPFECTRVHRWMLPVLTICVRQQSVSECNGTHSDLVHLCAAQIRRPMAKLGRSYGRSPGTKIFITKWERFRGTGRTDDRTKVRFNWDQPTLQAGPTRPVRQYDRTRVPGSRVLRKT